MTTARLHAAAVTFAAAALVLIAFLLWETRYSAEQSGAVLGAQLLIRALAIVAAQRRWLVAMFILFAAGFFPVGIYLLGVPSLWMLVGVADLLYLAAAIALAVQRRRR